MIPKRAFFYWSGDTMPWIRELSVESFEKFNPDWDVGVIHEPPMAGAIKRSDLVRYRELAERGGWYFDTDILFIRPMDGLLEEVGDADTVVCFDDSGGLGKRCAYFANGYFVWRGGKPQPLFYSVASLASAPKNDVFAELYKFASCKPVYENKDPQSCGVWAMFHFFGTLGYMKKRFPDHKIHPLQRKAFLPLTVAGVRDMYTEPNIPHCADDKDVYGIHWYGGDHSAKTALSWSRHTYWKNCGFGKLIQRVLGDDLPRHVSIRQVARVSK